MKKKDMKIVNNECVLSQLHWKEWVFFIRKITIICSKVNMYQLVCPTILEIWCKLHHNLFLTTWDLSKGLTLRDMGKLSFLWEAEGNVDLMLSYSFQCSKKFRMGALFKMLYMIGSLEASTKIVKAWFITSNSGSDCIVITRKNSINNKRCWLLWILRIKKRKGERERK